MTTERPAGLTPRNTVRGRPRTTGTVRCARCSREGEFYRRGICARCALRDDLTALLLRNPADPATANRLIDVLCQADRPESTITWKRSAKV